MVNHAPLCSNQEEAAGASEEKALAIRDDSTGTGSSFELVHTGGRPESQRRQIRRGSSRSLATRECRPLVSHHTSSAGVYTDDAEAYKTLACALIHQAYLDATNKREYERPNRENDRAENERSAQYFFESKAYRILCEILHIEPEPIIEKINETN
jgi:hypothetical protein